MSKKIKRGITVDEEIWNNAKHTISGNMSNCCENILKQYCALSDDNTLIQKELCEKEQKLHNLKLEIIALRMKLCNNQQKMKHEKEKQITFEDCMDSINRIHNKLGCIGLNQIKNIAKHNNVNYNELVTYCESLDLPIVNYAEGKK